MWKEEENSMPHTHFKHVHTLLQQGLDLLFPPRCVGCRQSGHLLCPTCLRGMQPLPPPFCQHCGLPLATANTSCSSCCQYHFHLHGLRFVHPYQDRLINAIRALKYTGQPQLAEPLGRLLAQAFTQYGMRADGLIPLPLHSQRQQQRGYNQATLLTRSCAAHLKLPCREDLVVRTRATRAQVGLNAQQRQQNVSGAFALAPTAQSRALAGATLVIIDDVCTTGATLEACAAPLYAAGAREIWGLVLGRPGGMTQDASKNML